MSPQCRPGAGRGPVATGSYPSEGLLSPCATDGFRGMDPGLRRDDIGESLRQLPQPLIPCVIRRLACRGRRRPRGALAAGDGDGLAARDLVAGIVRHLPEEV